MIVQVGGVAEVRGERAAGRACTSPCGEDDGNNVRGFYVWAHPMQEAAGEAGGSLSAPRLLDDSMPSCSLSQRPAVGGGGPGGGATLLHEASRVMKDGIIADRSTRKLPLIPPTYSSTSHPHQRPPPHPTHPPTHHNLLTLDQHTHPTHPTPTPTPTQHPPTQRSRSSSASCGAA